MADLTVVAYEEVTTVVSQEAVVTVVDVGFQGPAGRTGEQGLQGLQGLSGAAAAEDDIRAIAAAQDTVQVYDFDALVATNLGA